MLIVDENMQTVYSADTAFSCIIHHLNHRDLRRMAQKLETDGQNFVFFPMQRTRSSGFDRQRFAFPAPLPMSDDGADIWSRSSGPGWKTEASTMCCSIRW